MKYFVILVGACILFGCAKAPEYRLGDFTAASSFNVRNLDYDKTNATKVRGEDCHKLGESPNNSRLQRAMDDAIRNGQSVGVDGDLLVNVRIDQTVLKKPGFLGLPSKFNCIVVEGDLVKVKS